MLLNMLLAAAELDVDVASDLMVLAVNISVQVK